MASDHHEPRRSLFRLVCLATDMSVPQPCYRTGLCAIRFAYLHRTICRPDTRKLAVSRVSTRIVRETFTHHHSAHDLQGDTGDCRQDPASRQALVRHHASPASYWADLTRAQPPSFRFQPSSFVPATTKAKLLLKLCDAPTAHETLPASQRNAGTIDTTTRLIQVFFHSSPEADAERSRLLHQAHFVLFQGQLRSMRLPSATFNVADRELSLDWRRLCDTFMRDQFKCRYQDQNSVAWWRNFD